MGTKIVASFCLVFLSFCLFFGHNEATEVINLNWARVSGSNTEVQNCTESCDGVCGNGKCEPNESPCSCPCDCGFCCKDGFCRHDKGETFENCPSDCALTLKVQVVDADTNQALATSPFSPFPRTSVQCVTRSKTYGPEYVDENGAYSWTGVPADYYTCTATLQGFNTNSQQVLLQTLISDKNRPAVIPLSIQLGTVSGIVEFAVNSGPITAPLTGAEVVCNSTSGRLFFRQSESPFGKYFVANIPPGVYQCTASKKYYVPATQTISVSLQQNTASNFLLMPLPGNMIGQVIDTVSGLGVRRMQVICSSVSGITLTNRDGFFTLTGVPSGPITCSASGEGYITGSSSFTVGQGANVTTTIYVTSMTSNITGVVVNAKDANEFIWDAKINCIYNSSDYEGPIIQKIVYSDRYGNYFMDNFFAGNYTCNATRTSFAPLAIDIVVPIATKIQLDFKLEPYPTQISGRVLDKWSGLPVNEATIICYDNDRKFETGRKASQLDGTYTMPELIGGGSNTCSYQKWNYFTETVCEKLIRGVSYDWVVYLTPKTGNIAGVIRDIREPHFGIANATAVCSLEFNRNVTYGNPLGEYRFDNIRIGTQYCEYSAERFFPNSTSIVVNYNETSNGDIYLTPRPATVNIEVYDVSLGLLIPANVSCVDNEQKETNFTTDFLGLYQFVGVNSFGNWRCTASRPGFKPGTNTTVVDYGLTSRMILYITPDVGVIGGKVTDAVFGTPLTNAVVQCSRVVDVNYAVFSNSIGDYLIINLDRDIYYCTATAVGYVSASATVRVVEGGSSRQDYQLMPLPATLVIVVLDNNELKQIPLANATVLCSNLTTDANRTVARYLNVTGENGTVVFADLLTGNFSCDISYPNYVSQTKLTFLVGGETQKITVLLDPITVLITGTVFSSDSTPSNPITVAGAQIDVFEIRTGRMITRAFSSATNGQYSFAVRIPEFYAINVSATLFNSFYAPLGLISAARNIPITLVPAGILVVVNVTESGSNNVIVNAGVGLKRVIAGKPDQAISFLATDSQGRATFTGLATGTYRLSVSATGYEEPPTQLIDALFSGRIYSTAFQMSLKAGEVRGTIVLVGAASDNLEGFTVRILGTSLSTFTDNTGAYAFTSVAAGTYTIEVSNTGYNTASSNFTLTQGTSARLLPITVSKVTGGISGNIYKAGTLNTPTGVAVQVRVRLAGSDLNQYLGSATVPNGQTFFSIPGLPPGFLYDVVATAGQGSGWQDNVVQAQVVSGQMADVVIFLSQN